jgi:hypothetical protein
MVEFSALLKSLLCVGFVGAAVPVHDLCKSHGGVADNADIHFSGMSFAL